MKSILVALGAATCVAVAAWPAPVKAAPHTTPATLISPSWTGFYVGGNVGYSWGNAETDIASSGTTIYQPIPILNGISNNVPFSGIHNHDQGINGFIGGGQVGYNYKLSRRLMLGIEADIQGSAQRGSSTLVEYIKGTQCVEGIYYPPLPLACLTTLPLRGTAVTDPEAKIDWFGTIRERNGWLLTDDALLYVTGGLAYGHVSVSGNFNVSATTVPLFVKFGPSTNGFSSSETKIGFAVDAGIEGTCAAWVP